MKYEEREEKMKAIFHPHYPIVKHYGHTVGVYKQNVRKLVIFWSNDDDLSKGYLVDRSEFGSMYSRISKYLELRKIIDEDFSTIYTRKNIKRQSFAEKT